MDQIQHINKKLYLATAVCFSITVIVLFAYHDILGYSFWPSDYITTIDKARADSFGEAIKVISSPLMNGSSYVEDIARFYRPSSELSFMVDYQLWGLNPFGYYLTNFLLHLAVTILAFFLIYKITDRNLFTAWLTVMIVNLNPIVMNTISVIGLRQDVMLTFFLLLSLFFLLHYEDKNNIGRLYLILSFVCFILALGVKDTAVIVLPILCAFIFFIMPANIYSDIKNRLLYTLKISAPYIVGAIGFLSWRFYIVGGIGGYNKEAPGKAYAGIISKYITNLFYPVDFLNIDVIFSPYPSNFEQTSFLIVLIIFISLVIIMNRRISEFSKKEEGLLWSTAKQIAIYTSLLACAGFLAYPVVVQYLNQFIYHIYKGKSSLFNDLIPGKTSTGVSAYILKAHDTLLNALLVTLIFSLLIFVMIHYRKKVLNYLIHYERRNIMGFYLVWLLMPLFVYTIFGTSTHFPIYYMYIVLIPFSGILTHFLLRNLSVLSPRKKHNYFSTKSVIKALGTGAFVGVLIISFLLQSPLVSNYARNDEINKISSEYLYGLRKTVSKLPDDATIQTEIVYNNSGNNLLSYNHDYLEFYDYVIQSWIDLNLPDKEITVSVPTKTLNLRICKGNVIFSTKKKEQNKYKITVAENCIDQS